MTASGYLSMDGTRHGFTGLNSPQRFRSTGWQAWILGVAGDKIISSANGHSSLDPSPWMSSVDPPAMMPITGKATDPPRTSAWFDLDGYRTTAGTVMGARVVFPAETLAEGCELWSTDGTPEGTVRLTDIVAGPGSGVPMGTIVLANGLRGYFESADASQPFWETDGTPVGTRPFLSAPPEGFSILRNSIVGFQDGKLLFWGRSATQSVGLWATDGTVEGTGLLTTLSPSSGDFFSGRVGTAGGKTIFTWFSQEAGSEPWATDGTAEGTGLLADLLPGLQSGDLLTHPARPTAALGDSLVALSISTPITPFSWRVWITDGTPGGTRVLLERGSPFPAPHQRYNGTRMVGAKDRVYFVLPSAKNPEASPYSELWVTDGTTAGTRMVHDFSKANVSSNPRRVAESPGFHLYAGTGLWTLGPGAKDVVELQHGGEPMPVYGSSLAYGDRVVFIGGTAATGRELWSTDGASQEATLLREFSPGPKDGVERGLVALPSGILFTQPTLGVTDGTPGGTHDIHNPSDGSAILGASTPQVLGASAFFSDTGHRLWLTDGSESGTSSPAQLPSAFFALGSAKDAMWFRSNDRLWRSDGTSAGTAEVSAFARNPASLLEVPGGVCFFAFAGENSERSLWFSDGTESGTTILSSTVRTPGIPVGSDGGFCFTALDDEDGGCGLWFTDGTKEGMQELIVGGPGTTFLPTSAFGGSRALVSRFEVDSGVCELFVTDGTGPGTMRLTPEGLDASQVVGTAALGDGMLLALKQHSGSINLWYTDGAPQGTQMLSDFGEGMFDGIPDRPPLGFEGLYQPNLFSAQNVPDLGDVALFCATTPDHGAELWRTNGTAQGTMMLADIAPGSRGSRPRGFSVRGGTVYFTATDDDGVEPEIGHELWSTPIAWAKDYTPPFAPAPVDEGSITNSRFVRFYWLEPTDGEGSGVASVRLQAGTAPGLANVFDGEVTGTQVVVEAQWGQTVYARIITQDRVGHESASAYSEGILVDPFAQPSSPSGWIFTGE